MARTTSFLFATLAICLFAIPALAWSNSTIRLPDHALSSDLFKRDPDCSMYKGTENAFCGPLCGCNDGLTCIKGKCSTSTAPALIVPGCTDDSQCPSGMGCGWVTGAKADGTACGMRYAGCTKQEDCSGQYICVDAQYNKLIKGSEDYANCDGADQGQAFVCTYNDKNGPAGDSLCQNSDPNWNVACGDVRKGSPLTGVCNGMWTPCTAATPEHTATSCFWGYCIKRDYNGLSEYCTWKPGPCDTDDECDNGLKCGPTGFCGGPGASCANNNFCGDPYPCLDDGTGKSFCTDYNANLRQSPAKPYDNNSGLKTICDPNDNGDATCGSTSKCGSPRPGSDEPGVCGGAGATCYADSECATGSCISGTCDDWEELHSRIQDQPCTYSTDCASGLVCVDDGLGAASCRSTTSRNARVCQVGYADACDDDSNYGSCGFARETSVEMGVCGGQGATCVSNADCWTGTCNSDSKTCEFGPTPTAALNYRRNLARQICPLGQELCPVAGRAKIGAQLTLTGYECVDTRSTIDSCGGCIWGPGNAGRDCTDIDGVDEVSCFMGKCKINSCESGWTVSSNGTTCIEDDY